MCYNDPVGVSSTLSDYDTVTMLSTPGNRAEGRMSGKELLLHKAANRGLTVLLSAVHKRESGSDMSSATKLQLQISAASKAILH